MEENITPAPESKPNSVKREKDMRREIRRRTIKALAIWGVLAVGAPVALWEWIKKQPDDNSISKPLRKVLDFNGRLFKNFVSDNHLVKTYSKDLAQKNPRLNGDLGLKSEMSVDDYKIQVINFGNPPFEISLEEIMNLPKHEITYSFKCIEGWDMITNWGGALFSDFVARYKLATHSGNVFDKENSTDIANYAGLETPDGKYYVGLDIESALHSQTLLCYEMNGVPLLPQHGAPLRLITPTKYGIKNLKRIGKIVFTDERPPDYWFEQGYDYFSGL
ncbi:MAG: molybdopterin-dependent oxidoreductase [Chitinophagales bacterium]